jgi:hypothetical protein
LVLRAPRSEPRIRICAERRCTPSKGDVTVYANGQWQSDAIRGTFVKVTTVVPAEGAILERIRALHGISPEGLSRPSYAKLDIAQMKTAWGRRHRRRFALVEGIDVRASAAQYNFAAILDQRPVSVCGIGEIVPEPAPPAGGPAGELVDRLLERAARDGAAMALLFSDMSHKQQLAGFAMVPITDVEISVAEPSRRGAPMTLIRGGEERDLAAIVAMGQVRADPFRFHLDRDVDLVQYAITGKRLLAGLGTTGARQLYFFIAEEGITAAAYVVVSIVGGTWTVEECGDRDPSGARVGAILQALIARDPVERRPTIRAWLPRGFVPPQVTIVSAQPSTEVMMMRSLGTREVHPRLSGDDVLYWRSDIF